MGKRRVYELAKDYGMKGPEMAKLLQELGFEDVKTHMAVLDEPMQMMIQGRLEAAGIGLTSAGGEFEDDDPGTVTKSIGRPKKTLKKLPKPVAQPTVTPARRREPTRIEPSVPGPVASRPAAQTSEPTPTADAQPQQQQSEAAPTVEAAPPSVAPAPTPDEASRYAHPAEDAAAPAPAEEHVPPTAPTQPAVEIGPQTRTAADLPTTETAASAGASSEHAAEQAGASRATGAGAGPAVEPSEKREKEVDVKRLAVPQPKAKVVGRIELSTETIRDAGQRSAPAGERTAARTDPNLRRQMMDRLRTRSGQRSDRRSGPGSRQGAGFRGQGPRRGGPGQRKGGSTMVPIDPDKVVQIEPPVSVKRLSEALGIKVSQLLGILMKLGVMGVNINSFLDSDQVELVADECGRKIELVQTTETEAELLEKIGAGAGTDGSGAGGSVSPRAPVVTFMGHVDHGKTSLLDALRQHDMAEGEQAIAAGEAGGITQHIGAYKVTGRDGKQIVVLDTPGHAAFTAMRAHGANLTDVVVLVVAADDGVMPQTEEAINHAKAAEVPIVVAINKCDRPGANPMRTRQQLATLGLQPEEWGGSTQMVECSAVTGQGLDELIEKIDLEALVLELSSDPAQPARGTVIEAKQTAGQGNVVSLLVMDGTLRKGDYVLCGTGAGRVRNMIDDHGRSVDEVGPATPVEVLGLPELPYPGDKFYVVTDSKVAKEIADTRSQKARELNLAERQSFTLETMSARLASKDMKEIRIILKADVMGSLEPIRRSLTELSTDEVKVTILHSGLGGITIADIDLADASRAVIIGFNSVPDETARLAADRQGVQIRFYDVIYQLIDDVKLAMEGLLAPEEKEVVLGHAEIRAIFKVSRLGNIAGCFVTDGNITRNGRYRVVRDGRVVHTGKAASLRRVKDDVREVKFGFECGVRLDNYDDVKVGDVLECYEIQLEKRVLINPSTQVRVAPKQ